MGDFITPSLGFVGSAARFIAQLSSVRDETGVVIEQVKIVTNDITEAERFFSLKKPYLSDADRSRVEAVIRSTRVAVNRIAREVEPARASVAKVGTINGVERFDWVLRRSGSIEGYQHTLETCHRSLLDRISMLRGVRSNPSHHRPNTTEQLPSTADSHHSEARYDSDSDENGDSGSSGSSIFDETHPTDDLERTPIKYDETEMTNASSHPERALWEGTLLNHAKKYKTQKPNTHPERLLFEEMQKRYRQRTP